MASELTPGQRAGEDADFDPAALRKYKYPPEGCEAAIALVLKQAEAQAEALADDWTGGGRIDE